MRALIDTCVVIDALQERKPFSEEAKELILLVANQALDGFLTAKSLADIHYIMRRSTHDEQVTRKMLSDLFELFEVLDTRGIDCRMAIASGTSDFEDAIMIETAPFWDGLYCDEKSEGLYASSVACVSSSGVA